MLEFYDSDESRAAYIRDDTTEAEKTIDEDKELLLGNLFTVIDESAVAPRLKEPVKQAVLRVLFLGE
jgi:hypothetical protein